MQQLIFKHVLTFYCFFSFQDDSCFSPDELLAIHESFHSNDGVTMTTFMKMCPALIQQQIANTCEVEKVETASTSRRPTNAESKCLARYQCSVSKMLL